MLLPGKKAVKNRNSIVFLNFNYLYLVWAAPKGVALIFLFRYVNLWFYLCEKNSSNEETG